MLFERQLRPLPLSQIRLTDPFWTRWRKVVREAALPHQYRQIVETGRLANFQRAAKGERGGFDGYRFNDSDVYKWLEACAYVLEPGDSELRRMADEAIAAIEAAQEEDGYLNTFFQLQHPDLKWRNLGAMHEMYCSGHLIEAGVAFFQNLGERRLLEVAMRNAEHIASIFGPGKRRGYCGHQELELALIRLAEATGEDRYRELARWMIEERGVRPTPLEEELDDAESMSLSPYLPGMLRVDGEYQGEYCQDHAPIREHTAVVGHAVRAMYFYAAATDLADDEPLQQALVRVWDNLTGKRMYLTGGIGPAAKNEGFTNDYDLPNHSAYAETCAAVGLALWGRRLLERTGDSRYMDIVERALYNGAISGISLDGEGYFYTNPLESRGDHERQKWFSCACCPPNIARMIGSVGQFAASADRDSLWLHMPIGFEAEATIAGVRVRIEQKSDFPWSGEATLRISPERPAEFAVRVRIPDWADEVEMEIEGEEEPADFDAGYAIWRRTWNAGDRVRLTYAMKPRWIAAHPEVLDNLGRTALMHGPLVYCLEEQDSPTLPQRVMVEPESDEEPEIRFEPKLLDGVSVITVPVVTEASEFPDELYAEAETADLERTEARLIPYYAWCNRGRSHMQVWLRRL
jgi:uncharacterized protein